MSVSLVAQGVTAIQSGNLNEGARYLRQALNDDDLQGKYRASALIWLSETSPSLSFKIECHEQALEVDPTNQAIAENLGKLRASSSTPTTLPPESPAGKPPTLPDVPQSAPVQVNLYVQSPSLPEYQYTVGIHGGTNGKGTGFFITQNGLIATSRHVASGASQLEIELEPNRTMIGNVVRSFPEYDLALIATATPLQQLLPATTAQHLPLNSNVSILEHGGENISAVTQASNPAGWFVTTIRSLNDGGGSPVFDQNSQLVGMMTLNKHQDSQLLCGLHISRIAHCVDVYMQEAQHVGHNSGTYCSSCGILSQLSAPSAFYCENCGTLLPGTEDMARFPLPNTAILYGEIGHPPCQNCGVEVGYSADHRCLRCGIEQLSV